MIMPLYWSNFEQKIAGFTQNKLFYLIGAIAHGLPVPALSHERYELLGRAAILTRGSRLDQFSCPVHILQSQLMRTRPDDRQQR